MVKKSKKGKKKATKKLTPEEEKTRMIGVLMLKSQKSEEEILKSYNQFYAENPEGIISKEKYVATIKVLNKLIFLFSQTLFVTRVYLKNQIIQIDSTKLIPRTL